jgi:glutaminyl-peptide cyclotransferase
VSRLLAFPVAVALCACDGCGRVPERLEPTSAAAGGHSEPEERPDARATARPAVPSLVAQSPHDPSAFTQGLVFADGTFLESTGLYGESTLRRVDPKSGRVLAAVRLPPHLFAEGLARMRGELFQLTWREGVCIVYDERTFAKRREMTYEGEGWGLASDGNGFLVMSDGTPVLRFLEPSTFRVVRTVTVRDGTRPLAGLNELEWVRGEILANVWQTNSIARIDPESGEVHGYLDVATLPEPPHNDPDDVLNGIAYDEATGHLFVTGKRWRSVFEIDLPAR